MLARKSTRIVRCAVSTICQSVSSSSSASSSASTMQLFTSDEPEFVSDATGSYSQIIRQSSGTLAWHQLNCLTIQSSMILALCQAIIHQRQPTHSYTQTFRRFLGVVYIVLGPLSNVNRIYTILQYSPTLRGHRLPMGADQLSHTLNHPPIISRRLLHHPIRIPKTLPSTRCRYYILSAFPSTLASVIKSFRWTVVLCFHQSTTHSPTCDRNVSPIGTRSQAGSQVRTINLKASCPIISTVVVLLIVFQIAEQLIRLMTGGPQFSRCSHSPRLPSDSPVFSSIHLSLVSALALSHIPTH